MQATLNAGKLFLDTFETVRLLGSGGMGQAYLGKNIQTRQSIVIKVMHPHLAAEPGLRRLFAAEIDLLNHLVESPGALDQPLRGLIESDYATVTPHTRIALLRNIFNDAKVVLVVEADRLLGVLTKIDLIDYLASHRS